MFFTCALYRRTRKVKRNQFTTVNCADVEQKIKQAYEDIHHIPLSITILHQRVHKVCYGKYHRHYIYTSKNKMTPKKVSNRRVPLSDRTNHQSPTSLAPSPISSESQRKSVSYRL